MDEGERHAEECALIMWMEHARPLEQVALINISDVAVRGSGQTRRAMDMAATIMVQALLADLPGGADSAPMVVAGAMREARQRAGLPVTA